MKEQRRNDILYLQYRPLEGIEVDEERRRLGNGNL